jgi:DNA-binding transcriptional MerR regulator
MTSASSGNSEQPITGTISIGDVLRVLKQEFPDVTVSKIRFLETEGLVTPERTASGYRRFSGEHVDQLRAVLRMQRDQYLPLKVIRDHLHEGMLDEDRPASVIGSGLRAEDFRPGAGRLRMSRSELAEAANVDEVAIAQLESNGLITVNPAGYFDEDALAVTQVVERLQRFGVEPRHLRSFRVVTDRESGLIEQIATPYSQPRDRDARARSQETIRELAALFVQLHAALLRADLIRSGKA